MIHFKSVKFKNILSTGNALTEINLDTHKSTLIVGENGAGKSTMLDAVCFALYGKPFRKINKPQLINSINQKELYVEVNFNIGANSYCVKRGIKPNLFEIWKNGELLNQDAAARDYQAYLEENIIKMNFKSFGQVVVLGSSTFVPFMQLPAQQRREIIEDLLDIQIFSTMNVLLKERSAENKKQIVTLDHELELTQTKIDSAKSHNESIRKLRETEVNKLKEKLKTQLEFIETEKQNIDVLIDVVKDKTDSISDKQSSKAMQKKIEGLMNELNNKLSKLRKDIQFYEDHDNCPTCRQGIEHGFKAQTVEKNTATINEIETAKVELQNRLDSVEKRLTEISEVETEISSLNLKMSEHNANYKMSVNTCKAIKDELEDAEKQVEKVDDAMINDLTKQYKDVTKQLEIAYDEKETIAAAGSILKDGGIKTRIVKQYIPVMNKLINKYLASMDFFVDFQLDENFNETIKSRFRDVFTYSSFSEGEKLRIDLALLFTWRAVAKLRNSVSTNLLIMDEIMDSSLDNSGTEEFMKIINELTADSNVFIISHKGDQLYEKFETVIKFEKVKNFSRIAA